MKDLMFQIPIQVLGVFPMNEQLATKLYKPYSGVLKRFDLNAPSGNFSPAPFLGL